MSQIKDDGLVLASRKEFSSYLGLFYVVWSTAEIETSYALGQFLSLPHAETHLVTARMEFSRKVALLRALVTKSTHKNKAAVVGALNKMQNESKRNVFAHSFIRSTHTTVTFVERTWEGTYKTKKHKFTLDEFQSHVLTFQKAARAFGSALQIDAGDFQDFCDAADTSAANKA